MTTKVAIKQLEERNVPSEIVHMVWSDRMDLVALANVKGEVALHRLAWSKPWTFGPPKENLQVSALCWRPDGKFIAIAYSSGLTVLVKVENKGVLSSFEMEDEITCMRWIQCRKSAKEENTDPDDNSHKFIPEFISQSSFDSNSEEPPQDNSLHDQSHLNLLLTGTSDGLVEIRIFGCLLCGSINVRRSCPINYLHFNEDLSTLYIIYRDTDNNVKISLFNTNVLNTSMGHLFSLALKYVRITSLLKHLTETITTVTESWESILLEMDNKLSKYASKVPEGGVSADFLDLLTFGHCSDTMRSFLIHDLTIKGLEKFGQTIEMSYSNIQKLMLKYVTRYAEVITYHLEELRGMARLTIFYSILGLEEDPINDAIVSTGAFLIKGTEMQQIINHSIMNYQAFFRWVYIAIMNLLEEQIPNEVPRMTQQDLSYITEFLQSFDAIGGANSQKNGFIMERLGQYLSDAPLFIPPDLSSNDWSVFLATNQCVQNDKGILRHFPEMSLIQQYKHLRESIGSIFSRINVSTSKDLSNKKTYDCFEHIGPIRSSQFTTNKDNIICVFLQPPQKIHTLYFKGNRVLVGSLYFSGEGNDFNVLDVKVYSTTVLSCLLQDSKKLTILYQVPLTPPLDQLRIVRTENRIFENAVAINCFDLTPKLYQPVKGMVAVEFAVSGARKVGIVLGENRRKIRLYEMEGEEEEEDTEMTNSSLTEAVDSEMPSQ